jgi:dienelactone hydrolase
MRRQVCCLAILVFFPAISSRAGLLSVPEGYTPEKSWPVIICTQDGPSKEIMKKTPFFLVHAGGKGTAVIKKIESYLVSLANRYNIDPYRIYATSFSRGGHEILVQTVNHPHWFAAIAPVCNDLRRGPYTEYVKYLKQTPTLLIHGDRDSFVRTGKQLFETMKSAGCPVQFQTYPGGHSPNPLYRKDMTTLIEFFQKHVMNPYPKTVEHVVTHKRYARAFWVDCMLVKDAGGMKAVYKVSVEDGNKIRVEANEQIASLELHLTGKLLDMEKPVTVRLGDKELYSGKAQSPLVVKLREGQKYYRSKRIPLWEKLAEIREKKWGKKTAEAAK